MIPIHLSTCIRRSLQIRTIPTLWSTSYCSHPSTQVAILTPGRILPSRNFATQATSLNLPIPPILFVTGGPGAGKGTQCTLLTNEFGADVRGQDGNEPPAVTSASLTTDSTSHQQPLLHSRQRNFGVAHISVGAVLRHALVFGGALSDEDRSMIQSILSTGGILPASLTVRLLRAEFDRLLRAQAAINPSLQLCLLIDGFPRTMDNVNEFEKQCGPIENILLIDCDETHMKQRLSKRGRSDDTPTIIERRIEGFKNETQPVVDWFRQRTQLQSRVPGRAPNPTPTSSTIHEPNLFTVDGRPSIERVWIDVQKTFAQFLQLRMNIKLESTNKN